MAVREVSAVSQVEAEDRITRLENGQRRARRDGAEEAQVATLRRERGKELAAGGG